MKNWSENNQNKIMIIGLMPDQQDNQNKNIIKITIRSKQHNIKLQQRRSKSENNEHQNNMQDYHKWKTDQRKLSK